MSDGPKLGYDLRWDPRANEPVFLTWRRGYAFRGWISPAEFAAAEQSGRLTWSPEGRPTIHAEEGSGPVAGNPMLP